MSHYAEQLMKQAYETRHAGDRDASLGLYRNAADAAADDPTIRAHCLRHIGDLERESGRIVEAQVALREAEALYRSVVSDPLSLANTVRLRALVEDSTALWKEARILYENVGAVSGIDMSLIKAHVFTLNADEVSRYFLLGSTIPKPSGCQH